MVGLILLGNRFSNEAFVVGTSELLFNPLIQWWRRGPICRQIHRFLWSNAPLHYKISMMAYMFSYCKLCLISSQPSYPHILYRWYCRLRHNCCHQLRALGVPIPRGWRLSAQFRDLAGDYGGVFRSWESRLHTAGVPSRRETPGTHLHLSCILNILLT